MLLSPTDSLTDRPHGMIGRSDDADSGAVCIVAESRLQSAFHTLASGQKRLQDRASRSALEKGIASTRIGQRRCVSRECASRVPIRAPHSPAKLVTEREFVSATRHVQRHGHTQTGTGISNLCNRLVSRPAGRTLCSSIHAGEDAVRCPCGRMLLIMSPTGQL